jgi:hypothetical protein
MFQTEFVLVFAAFRMVCFSNMVRSDFALWAERPGSKIHHPICWARGRSAGLVWSSHPIEHSAFLNLDSESHEVSMRVGSWWNERVPSAVVATHASWKSWLRRLVSALNASDEHFVQRLFRARMKRNPIFPWGNAVVRFGAPSWRRED